MPNFECYGARKMLYKITGVHQIDSYEENYVRANAQSWQRPRFALSLLWMQKYGSKEINEPWECWRSNFNTTQSDSSSKLVVEVETQVSYWVCWPPPGWRQEKNAPKEYVLWTWTVWLHELSLTKFLFLQAVDCVKSFFGLLILSEVELSMQQVTKGWSAEIRYMH